MKDYNVTAYVLLKTEFKQPTKDIYKLAKITEDFCKESINCLCMYIYTTIYLYYYYYNSIYIIKHICMYVMYVYLLTLSYL